MLSLAYGVWLGLVRVGWVLPLPRPEQLILHGPLMIGGFLGTLIGLERAVGIAKPWAYAAPICSASGAALLVFGPPGPAGPLLITLASTLVVAVFGTILRREPSLFAWTMAIGTGAWLAGNAMWLTGSGIYRVVFWWIGFVVLTIAGERLELTRVLRPTRLVRVLFAAAVAATLAGAMLVTAVGEAGVRVTGLGLLGLSAWLALNDVARRTVRQSGLTRFIAVCLLAGYFWLAVGAGAALATGAMEPGFTHDAILHAIFLGFVVSMIFGHAPIVFPAVLRRPLPFRAAFYTHLIALQLSVAVRVAGGLVDSLAGYRSWGGLLNAVALVLFVLNTLSSIVTAAPRKAA